MIFPRGTWAVVGNGPAEVGKGFGWDIDAHDYVVRLNNFELLGHESDYGARCTHWATTFAANIRRRVAHDFQRIYCTRPMSMLFSDGIEPLPYLGRTAFMPQVVWDKRPHFSAGIMLLHWMREDGLDMAMVDVYGFSFFDKSLDHHYFTSTNDIGVNDHNGQSEREAYFEIMHREPH